MERFSASEAQTLMTSYKTLVQSLNFFLFFNGYLFIFERERERESTCTRMRRGGAEREGESERIPSRLPAVGAEPDAGLDLTNREIMT